MVKGDVYPKMNSGHLLIPHVGGKWDESLVVQEIFVELHSIQIFLKSVAAFSWTTGDWDLFWKEKEKKKKKTADKTYKWLHTARLV